MFKRPIASIAEDGTQGLFKKLAAYLDRLQKEQLVYTNQNVTKILRDDTKKTGRIKVTINDTEQKEYDTLIFAAPPKFILDLMDKNQLSEKEMKLFSKFKFHPYYVGMFGTLGKGGNPLPAYYYNNIYPDTYKNGDPKPEPVQFTKRWDDTNLIARGYNWELANVFDSDDSPQRKELEKVFATFMKERMETPDFEFLKPSLKYPVVDKNWKAYFPHVSIEDVQDGFYDELETLQGMNNIYFSGSSMTFEMMETTVAYSQYLVNKYF